MSVKYTGEEELEAANRSADLASARRTRQVIGSAERPAFSTARAARSHVRDRMLSAGNYGCAIATPVEQGR